MTATTEVRWTGPLQGPAPAAGGPWIWGASTPTSCGPLVTLAQHMAFFNAQNTLVMERSNATANLAPPMAKKTKRSTARRRSGTPAARPSAAPAASATSTRTAPPRVAPPPQEAPADVADFADVADVEEEAPASVHAEPEAAPPQALDVPPHDSASDAPAAETTPLRRVGRVDPATRRPRPAPAPIAQAPDLDANDPSIPLARVPYATGDLRGVLMIGSIMVALIIIATVLVAVLVK